MSNNQESSLVPVAGFSQQGQVDQALWEVNDFPQDLQPSRSQFGALVSGCSGLFLSTPFTDIVQRMAGPYKTPFGEMGSPASPDLAATINGLFQVSIGRLKAIDIHGGIDIAFVSAVAYWLFDLRIWVQMHDGSVLFSNCSHLEEAVVRLQYTEEGDPRQKSLIQISATTFILGSVKDLFTEVPYASIIFRVKWENCLTQILGHGGKRIQDQASLLGKALGAIARIYEAIAKCEVDVGGFSRIHFVNFQPRGYGRSFISSIGTILPEIGSHQAFIDRAEQSLSQHVSNSVTTIYDLLIQLEKGCRCSVCERETSDFEFQICDVAALLFLRKIGDIMAHVNIDSPITPTADGLRGVYESQCLSWNDASRKSDGLTAKDTHRKSWLGMAVGIPCISDPGPNMEKLQPTGVLLDSILDQVSRLFMGPRGQEEFSEGRTMSWKPHCTAFSRDGACMWLDALRSANADPSSMSTIHVIPGQISYRNKQYTSVWDLCHPSQTRRGTAMPLARFTTPGASGDLPMQVSLSSLVLQAIVTERGTDGTIGIAYQVRSRSDLRCLQPGMLTEALLASTGRFPCSKSPDCSNEVSASSYVRKSGWDLWLSPSKSSVDNIRYKDGGAYLLWGAPDPISKFLAMEGLKWTTWHMQADYESLSLLLLGSGQCMACLARHWQKSKNTMIMEHFAYVNPGSAIPSPTPDFYIHVI